VHHGAGSVVAQAWYDRLGDTLPDIAGIVGGVLAAIALAGFVRSWWRRTLGRRSDRYARLARLGTGAQLSLFTAVLGEPPAIRRKLTA
jgi:hypothetical protein